MNELICSKHMRRHHILEEKEGKEEERRYPCGKEKERKRRKWPVQGGCNHLGFRYIELVT